MTGLIAAGQEETMADSRTALDQELQAKYDALRESLRQLGKVAVAFSAGVDSTLLLKVAHDELGDDVLAVTACAAAVPKREIEEARSFCCDEGVRHELVETHEFEIEGFDHNPPERCYLCKREILARIIDAASKRGFAILVEGSNCDDASDYRPGARAVTEAGVASPLRDAGFSKSDVRTLARHLGLTVWDKPAFACLNTRFAFGDLLSPERLEMVDEAEMFLRENGFTQVRVRVQGSVARIEVAPDEVGLIAGSKMRERVADELERIGFDCVSVDLRGYRMGSMNGLVGRRAPEANS